MPVCPHRWLTVLALLLASTPPCHGAAGHESRYQRDEYRLTLQVSEGFSPATREEIGLWIHFLADTLWQVYDRWPRAHWMISVDPGSGSAEDPIPWGQVQRGAIDRVEFFVLPSATAATLKQAWTGYHELAHLLIPYRGWGDAWFSEGLATYYQNLLQARSGILDEQQMWQRLGDGFLRGRADDRFDGEPLHKVSDAMREQGGYMRVYWSGAWYFLAADIRLREQSNASLSLDIALEKLNRCCGDMRLSVQEIVTQLDRLNGVELFQPLYEELRTSTRLPSFEPLFQSLGIELENEVVRLQDEGPGARLRRRMVSGNSL